MSLSARLALAYLLNSMWQLPLLYCIGLLLDWAARKTSADVRHRLWVGILLLQVLLPAICFLPSAWMVCWWHAILSAFGLPQQNGGVTVTVTVGAAHAAGAFMMGRALFPALLTAYASWSTLLGGRLLYRLWRIRVLRSRSIALELSPAALGRWQELRAHFLAKEDAELRASSDVAGPVTIGMRRKLLLVPSWFTYLPLAEMEIGYAHELVHMQRNDYAKNLVYEFFALAAAYHPFLHFTRMRLAESREMVCDALAAESLNGPAPYAKALLRLAARCVSARKPVNLPQAIGILDANTLERRLMSLKAGRHEVSLKHRWAIFSVCGIVLAGTYGSAMALRVSVPQAQTAAQGIAATSEQPVQVSGALMAGHTVTKVPPVYPEAARQARMMGSVVLAARIGADGHVQRLTVISGAPELQASAMTAVQHWIYEPYLLNGSPVPVDTTVTINYQLAQ